MSREKLIVGKRLLIVDDEKDVLDTLYDLLTDCKIDQASSYEEAAEFFENSSYDLAILDIMGVRGYDLLKIANEKDIPAIMLTAHALSQENLLRSAEEGAVYYAPKEELVNIKDIVIEVIEALENKKSTWERMFDRLAGYYDKKFNGPDWREKEKQFWEGKFTIIKQNRYSKF